jgi:hypothetical protein
VLKHITSINYQHQVLLDKYLNTVISTIAACTGRNTSKLNDFIDVANIIIEHHNTYKHDLSAGNYLDFMSIIPTNMSIAIQGFMAGIETKRNSVKIRAYRLMLTNYAFDLVKDLETIKLYND